MKEIIVNLLKENKIKELKELILHAVYNSNPSAFNILLELFALSEIKILENDPEVPTLAISFKNGFFTLHINREFVEEYITSGEEFCFVILHELMHKVTGDLNVFPLEAVFPGLWNIVNNVVADFFVNHTLIHQFKINAANFLKTLYKEGDILNQFLIINPTENNHYFEDIDFEKGLIKLIKSIDPQYNISNIPSHIIKRYVKEFVSLHNSLQDGFSLYNITKMEVYNRLKEIISSLIREAKIKVKIIPIVLLIGDHSGYLEKYIKKGSPTYKEISDKLKDLFPHLRDAYTKFGSGYSPYLLKERINPYKVKRVSRKITEIVKKALTEEIKKETKIELNKPMLERGVIPSYGRKEFFLLSQGVYPVFFPTLLYNTIIEKVKEGKKVHLYVDVSRSVYSFLPLVLGIIEHLKEWLGEEIYQFSNQVVPVSLEQIKKGNILTTHGTDLDCVIAHALKKKFKKIMVITDGHAPICNQEKLSQFKKECEPFIVITKFYRNHHLSEEFAEIGKTLLEPLFGTKFNKEKDRHWWLVYLEDIAKI